MTKKIALEAIYSSREVDEVMLKIKPDYNRDDIKQTAFLELLEKPEELILELYHKNKLRHYVVKTIYNTANFSESKHNRQHRRAKEIPTECFPCTPIEDTEEYEDLLKACVVKVSELDWYKRELLTLYAQEGTYRKLEALTGIPLNSIHDAVKKAKEEIKKNLWE
jgi:DNA-directed RNA polymerase specialized sigma24 family protein